MTATNGHAPAADPQRAELRRARLRTRLIREQIEEKRLERAKRLQESAGFWVEPYAELWARLRFQEWRDFGGIASRHDRRWGRDFPLYVTEQELALLRAPARVLCGTNPFAQGLVNGVSGYVIGAKTDLRATCPDQKVQKAAQAVLDRFLALNEWHGGQFPSLERELFARRMEDGEWFLHHVANDDGTTSVRTVEPEQVTIPPGEDMREYGFGVRTPPDDTQKVEAFWVVWGETPGDGEEYEPDCMTHCKRNVKRSMKRGVPDFSFGTYEQFSAAMQLTQNLGETAAVQAAIAAVRQHKGATVDQVTAFRDDQTDYLRTDYARRQYDSVQRYKPGRFEDMGENSEYVEGPTAANGQVHLAILLGVLRAAGRRWQAPDWLASGDASVQNFATSLTAESPFVRVVVAEQGETEPLFARSGRIALENWVRHHNGLEVRTEDGTGVAEVIPAARALAMVKVECKCPSPETHNKLEEAQISQVESQAQILSPQTWQQRVGLDPEKESKNLAEWRESHPESAGQPLQLPGQGGGDNPLGAGLGESLLESSEWVSRKIAKLRDEGKPQDQAVAIALSMAREKGVEECGGEGGEPGPCPTAGERAKALAAKAWGKVRESVVSQFHELEGFYGRGPALAIVGVAALPLPGTTAAPLAAKLLAKAVQHVRGRLAGEALEAQPGMPDLAALAKAVARVWARACEITGEPAPELDGAAVRAALAKQLGG